MEQSPDPRKSIYDPDDTDDQDLWFLPADPEDAPPVGILTGTKAINHVPGAADWLHAERQLGREIAAASAAMARYDERLTRLPECQNRIALICASAALQAQGDWLPSERIALYLSLREKSGDDGIELSKADWAVRRWLSGLDPREDLNGYLGRHPTDRDGFLDLDLFGEPARGDEFADLAGKWRHMLNELDEDRAPPIVLSAAAFHHWRMIAISADGAIVEPAVIATVLAAGDLNAGFVPVLLAGRGHVLARGTALDRLKAWSIAVRDGCVRALMELERLENWQNKALSSISDLSGRTPPLLIGQLLRSNLASTDMLSIATGASKAAIRRNMATLERRDLVREVTGQGRFRFWTAAV